MKEGDHKEILQIIASENDLSFTGASPLSGGDINDVYKISCKEGNYVVKINSASRFPGMFEAEKRGLEKLREPRVIDVPAPIATGEIERTSYLLLEFQPTARKKKDFWEIFGKQLAQLHQISAQSFGLDHDNFIGSLPQYNNKKDTAAEFYISMRLEPQLKMASDRGFDLNISNSFFKNCEKLIPSEKPSLIHGDLWGGNYMVNQEGMPSLIDPAVAYAPREMDLGMMKLFGGFDEELFRVYDDCFPLQPGWENRIPLWQLYYLLVHLNIFGAGYRSQVMEIIKKYS